MGANLMLHCGGEAISKEDLSLIPTPDKTATYSPVGHWELSKRILEVSQDLLNGYTLKSESYGVAQNGQQLFAVATFQNGEEEMGLSVGWRNALNKSLTVGFCYGNNIFVCDNLALRGDVSYMRKHTGEVWTEIETQLIAVCYRATRTYKAIAQDAQTLKALPFDDRRAFQTMGELYGMDIIAPRQLSVVKAEWLKPSYEAFQPRTAWSFYNAVTESLKTSPPSAVMENHVNLSKYFNDNVIELSPLEFKG